MDIVIRYLPVLWKDALAGGIVAGTCLLTEAFLSSMNIGRSPVYSLIIWLQTGIGLTAIWYGCLRNSTSATEESKRSAIFGLVAFAIIATPFILRS